MKGEKIGERKEGGYQPSEEEMKRTEKSMDLDERLASDNREMLNRIREMREEGFRNLTVEIASKIAEIGKNINPREFDAPHPGLGLDPEEKNRR